MNKKVINVSRAILSLIIIIDIILISLTLIFDVPNDIYQKIMLFDIVTCILLLFDFFMVSFCDVIGFFRYPETKKNDERMTDERYCR